MSELDGCRRRIERAVNARQILNREGLNAFDHVYGYRVFAEPDPSTPDEWVVFFEPPDELPVEWPLVIGEIIQNTRNALDNLAWLLAETCSGPAPWPVVPPWRDVEFPIQKTQGGFNQRTKSWRHLIAPSDWAIIEKVQPYQRGNSYFEDFLWRLAELSNADKHRALHLLVAHKLGDHPPWRAFSARDATITDVRETGGGKCSGKTELARLTVQVTGPNPDVDVDDGFRFQIAIDHPSVNDWDSDAIGVLSFLTNHVAAIVERFAPRFP